MVRVGLIGLPNAGKSTLFNFLTNANALVAPYPFATVEPNKSVFKYYDTDFIALSKMLDTNGMLVAEVELWDIAGLIENASFGEGLGNEFLGQIKVCDILIHILRANYGATAESLEDSINIVMKEVSLFDHKCLQQPFEKARRMAKLYPKEQIYTKKRDAITKLYYDTRDTVYPRYEDQDMPTELLNELQLIITKPKVLLLNGTDSVIKGLKIDTQDPQIGGDILELSSMGDLTEKEQAALEFDHQSIGKMLEQICGRIRIGARLKRFYTIGHLGAGLWLVDERADVGQCAALVHKDMLDEVKGVKVAQLSDFYKHGSWTALSQLGLIKKFGNKYIPSDQDILQFEK